MSSLLVILIGTVLANTFLLMQGDDSLGGDRHSGSIAVAIRIGAATGVLFLLSTCIVVSMHIALQSIDTFWPNDAWVFTFSLTVVSIALVLERFARRQLPQLRRALASSPLLIVANSLALGATLFQALASRSAVDVMLLSIGVAITFMMQLAAFIALAARITERAVPHPFRFAPITLISAGLTALALMGFTGILRG